MNERRAQVAADWHSLSICLKIPSNYSALAGAPRTKVARLSPFRNVGGVSLVRFPYRTGF